MTAISPKQKERLQNALDRITDECSNGSDPNDAIVKIAKDMDLHEDELPLLVRGYNVGATNAQWKSTKDQQIKLAEFPIADIDVINNRLYPAQVKTAGVRRQKVDNTFVKSASTIFEGCFNKKYDYNALPMTKSAEHFDWKDDLQEMFKKEEAILQQIHHIQDDYMLKKYAAKRDFDTKVEEFAECLQNPYAPSLEMMKQAAKDLTGVSGEKLIQYTLERFPSVLHSPRLIKSAEAITSDSKFYKTLNSALTALDSYIKIDLEEKKAYTKCASALEPVAKTRKEAVYGDEMDQALLSPDEVYENQMKKQADSVIPSLDDYISRTSGPSWDLANPIERSALKELADRSPLRNQKVRSLLLDLMSSDPYLRQQDPDVIAAAFNDLYEANPTDALKRIWLKTHLPQYIASENLDAPMVTSMIESGRSAEKSEKERIKSLFDEFMNSVGIRERDKADKREDERAKREEERDKYQREVFEYQKKQDDDRKKYQKDRDKELDKRYKDETKYQRGQDAARTRYQRERDSIMDDRNELLDAENLRVNRVREKNQRDEFNYRKDRDTAKDKEEARKDEIARLKEERLEKERADRNTINDQRWTETQARIEKEKEERELRKKELEDNKQLAEKKRQDAEAAREKKRLDDYKIKNWEYQNNKLNKRLRDIETAIGDSNNKRNQGAGPANKLSQRGDYRDTLQYVDSLTGANKDTSGTIVSRHPIYYVKGINENTDPDLVDQWFDAYNKQKTFLDDNPTPYQSLLDSSES